MKWMLLTNMLGTIVIHSNEEQYAYFYCTEHEYMSYAFMHFNTLLQIGNSHSGDQFQATRL